MAGWHALVVFVLVVNPSAADSGQQPAAQVTPAVAAPVPQVSAEDAAALRRIRRALETQPAGKSGARLPIRLDRPRPTAAPVPTYRVEVIGRFPVVDFRTTLKASLAERLPAENPGFLGGAPGTVHPGAALISGAVGVNPAAIVRVVQRWTRNRAIAKARREVAEELAAVIKAQEAAAQKKTPDR